MRYAIRVFLPFLATGYSAPPPMWVVLGAAGLPASTDFSIWNLRNRMWQVLRSFNLVSWGRHVRRHSFDVAATSRCRWISTTAFAATPTRLRSHRRAADGRVTRIQGSGAAGQDPGHVSPHAYCGLIRTHLRHGIIGAHRGRTGAFAGKCEAQRTPWPDKKPDGRLRHIRRAPFKGDIVLTLFCQLGLVLRHPCRFATT